MPFLFFCVFRFFGVILFNKFRIIKFKSNAHNSNLLSKTLLQFKIRQRFFSYELINFFILLNPLLGFFAKLSEEISSITVPSESVSIIALSQQADAPPSGRTGGSVFRECGYTPYACYGISFLTTTTVNTLHFSKPIRKSSRTIHAGFLKNYGYSYIIYFVLLCRLERSGV